MFQWLCVGCINLMDMTNDSNINAYAGWAHCTVSAVYADQAPSGMISDMLLNVAADTDE